MGGKRFAGVQPFDIDYITAWKFLRSRRDRQTDLYASPHSDGDSYLASNFDPHRDSTADGGGGDR